MLHSRGHSLPSEFAGADIDAMKLGLVTQTLLVLFLKEYTMVLNGVDNPDNYGKLFSTSGRSNLQYIDDNLKQLEPHHGLLVLEAQERVLAFLVNCCRQILQDIPKETLISDAFPIQIEAPKIESKACGFKSLAVMAAEAPYRVPVRLDLGQIESLLQARVSAAKDHVLALREDPAYFSDYMVKMKDHRLEMLKDIFGNPHPHFSPDSKHIWAGAVASTVVHAYMDLEMFTHLCQQAHDLRLLQAKYAPVISPTKDLPDEFLAALVRFQYFLNDIAGQRRRLLPHYVAGSPSMRKYLVLTPFANSGCLPTMASNAKRSKVFNYLDWLITTLCYQGASLFQECLPLFMDEIQRLRNQEPEAWELTSSLVGDVVDDLSIIAQCLGELELYQPWARTFMVAKWKKYFDLSHDWFETHKHCSGLATFDDSTYYSVARLANPSKKRFFYPCDKSRTKENVEAMQSAERHLDEFWAGIDRVMLDKAEGLRGSVVWELLSQGCSLNRTPDWIEEQKAVARKPAGKRITNDYANSIHKPLSTLYFGEGSAGGTTEVTQPTSPVRSKTKTRGQARVTSTKGTAEVIFEAVAKPTTIPVDARALKVFRTLFFNPERTSSRGEIPWIDFVYAMVSVGFSAEKLHGSVWHFQRIGEAGQRSILFHDPHPRQKLQFNKAREYGRRLSRAFGWAGEMFVLKEKYTNCEDVEVKRGTESVSRHRH